MRIILIIMFLLLGAGWFAQAYYFVFTDHELPYSSAGLGLFWIIVVEAILISLGTRNVDRIINWFRGYK